MVLFSVGIYGGSRVIRSDLWLQHCFFGKESPALFLQLLVMRSKSKAKLGRTIPNLELSSLLI